MTRAQLDLSTRLLPREVEAIRRAIAEALRAPDPQRPGHSIGSAKAGIYAFYDYDSEPIYVGQTAESFSTRLRRHLTGQRSDAVAKYVLDPFEVHTVKLWSLPHIAAAPQRQRKVELDPYEHTVYRILLAESEFGAILNEGNIPASDLRELPEPVVRVIIPDDIFPDRSHPDVRIARRAQTIALLAKNISERRVSAGLRRTLTVQTNRLHALARARFEALGGASAVEFEADEDGTVEESDEV
jgi:hypothetical protein